MNAWRLRRRVRSVAFTHFVTLTFDSSLAPGATRAALALAALAWSRVRKWMRRRGLRKFLRVVELGERGGRLHLHVLAQLGGWLDYRALHRELRRAGFGRVADFQKLRNRRGVTAYVTKYVCKCEGAGWPKWARRFQTDVPRLRSHSPREAGWCFFTNRQLVASPLPKWLSGVQPADARVEGPRSPAGPVAGGGSGCAARLARALAELGRLTGYEAAVGLAQLVLIQREKLTGPGVQPWSLHAERGDTS
ncbi:MAG: hypothetical protein M1582_05190 [Actinobacteria bacterium]|jgi:hypothetical protein|nr:hypothetical protein [Actinomycetota bacterium]